MWPVVQPGIDAGVAIAPVVAAGLNANPNAQSAARKSLITP